MHYGARLRAGIARAAPALHPAERVASAQALLVRRPASEIAAPLPADPFAGRPRLCGRGSHRLSGRPAVFVLASLIVALLASSTAPTPLYAIYQAQWHFTPITTTVVFGVYALAVLAALLTLGKLSDHVGRRPVHRRGPGRDRRGHAGYGPRARHLRQRGGAGHGQCERRDPVRAGGPLPAR